MKRNPSIHITLDKFNEILDILEVPYFPINAFFMMAQKKAITNRSFIAKAKEGKALAKLTLSEKGDAQLASDILYSIRIKGKEFSRSRIKKITPDHVKDWALCKELADTCNGFCEEFQLPLRKGYITYMEIGMSLIKNRASNIINKLVHFQEAIYDIYNDQLEVEEHQTPLSVKEGVQAIHDYFIQYIASTTGIYERLEEPTKYVHFCRLYDLLTDRGWDYKEYIKAQFEALAFCNGIPELNILYQEKGISRFNKYLYQQRGKTTVEETPVIKGSLWSRINKGSHE